MIKKIATFALIALTSQPLLAVQSVTGYVTKISAHTTDYQNTNHQNQKGLLFISMAELPASTGSCNNVNRRVVVRTDHPLYGTILSIANAAYLRGEKIKMAYNERCSVRSSAADFATIQTVSE